MIPSLPPAQALRLTVIRAALLLGLLLFGAATWFQQTHGSLPQLPSNATRLYGYVFAGLVPCAVAGMFLMRKRIEAASEIPQMIPLYIAGYAMAEGVALFGAVTWFLGGDRTWYIAGLVVMVVAFQILPINRQR